MNPPKKIEPQFAHVHCMNSGSLVCSWRNNWLEDVMLALVVELMETLQAGSRLEPTNPGIERNDSWMPGVEDLLHSDTKNIRSGFNLLFLWFQFWNSILKSVNYLYTYIIYLYT